MKQRVFFDILEPQKKQETKIIKEKKLVSDIYQFQKPEIRAVFLFFSPRLILAIICGLGLIIAVLAGLGLILKKDLLTTKVSASSQRAQNHFLAASSEISDFNLNEAQNEFRETNKELDEIRKMLNGAGQTHIYLSHANINQPDLLINLELFSVISDLSLAGENLTTQLINFSGNQVNADFFTKISELQKEIDGTLNLVLKSQEKLAQISPKPYSYSEKLTLDFQSKLSQLAQVLNESKDLLPLTSLALGKDSEKTYLLLFQNPREARPTGGFLGSWGFLKIKQGKIADLFVSDIYSLKFLGNEILQKDPTLAPEGFPQEFDQPEALKKINPYPWVISDSNWLTDFSVVAPKIEWLMTNVFKKEKVDGVISLDPAVLEDILEITGPIPMDKYGITLSSENFWDEVEKNIEIDSPFKKGDKSVNPKQILIDFAPMLLDKINNFDNKGKGKLVTAIFQNLAGKHILLFSNEPQIEKKIQSLGWAGDVSGGYDDYLEVNISSHNSLKTSKSISKKLSLSLEFRSDGSSLNTLEIDLAKKPLINQFLDCPNISYYKIMVPAGSRLIKIWKNEQEIYNKDNKDAVDAFFIIYLFNSFLNSF